MKTAIELITKERAEQIEKHGFDSSHDETNDDGELRHVAACLITGAKTYYPDHWDKSFLVKFEAKDDIERLVVAGALIAAEIDRLKKLEDDERQTMNDIRP